MTLIAVSEIETSIKHVRINIILIGLDLIPKRDWVRKKYNWEMKSEPIVDKIMSDTFDGLQEKNLKVATY